MTYIHSDSSKYNNRNLTYKYNIPQFHRVGSHSNLITLPDLLATSRDASFTSAYKSVNSAS